MSVIRVEKDKNFTAMTNYHLRDNELSLKAIGLLSKMLSLPEDWDYSIAGLAAICKDGKAAIQTALKELEDRGYVTRNQLHSADGTFGDIEYIIYEAPPYTENRKTVDAPYTDFPSTDNPSTENQSQINTNKLNTKITKPPKAPQRGRRVSKSMPEFEPDNFEFFWDLYPRGEDRAKAVREWDKLKPDKALKNRMYVTLKRQLASEEWQRGIGIPYFCRWLTNERWNDEPKSPVAQGSSWAEDPELVCHG